MWPSALGNLGLDLKGRIGDGAEPGGGLDAGRLLRGPGATDVYVDLPRGRVGVEAVEQVERPARDVHH